MADNEWDVTLVEALSRLMEEDDVQDVKIPMMTLLKDKNVSIMTGTKLCAVTDEGVEVILPNGKKWGIEFDLIVMAVGLKKPEVFNPEDVSMHITPMGGTIGKIGDEGKEAHIIGDCAQLGRIREATEAGERIGRWV